MEKCFCPEGAFVYGDVATSKVHGLGVQCRGVMALHFLGATVTLSGEEKSVFPQ